MSIRMEVINLEQVERQLGLMKAKAPKVLKLAVNDTARKARSRLAKEAKKTYVVKVSGFNRVMDIKFATTSKPMAIIYTKGKKIPLAKFAFREGELGPERYYNPTLHRYQIGKGGISASGKVLKGTRYKPAQDSDRKWFVAKMRSGHVGVFQRNTGKKRGEKDEVSEKMGASIPEMIGNEKRVYGIVKPFIKSDLKDAVSRHISRALRGEI